MSDQPDQPDRRAGGDRRAPIDTDRLDPIVEAAIRAAVRSAAIVELTESVESLAGEVARYRAATSRRLLRRSRQFTAALVAFAVLIAGEGWLVWETREAERQRREDVALAVLTACHERQELERALIGIIELYAAADVADVAEREEFLATARERITSEPCDVLVAPLLNRR